jgi:uncharacterized protein YjeT (DUF2065 family)
MGVVGPFLVVALVLVVSGVAKIAAPSSAAAMLSAVAGRRVPPGAGRVVGVGEIGLGAIALAGWRPAVVVVGAAYVGFAAIAEVARRRGVPSCGCFGAAEAPPGATHVALDLVSAAVAFAAAATSGNRSLFGALDHGPSIAIGTVAALCAAVAMIIAAETVGAEVVAARRALAVVRPSENRHRR